ncbi:DedA family protein [Bacillus sp. JCM 19034]|uniref:DedA family protein n=1 Tax=Bacillus sp. JCM 19034 TaxID=1481928 RepID=UPI0007863658|nr:DedA family protein [Bacillus sp. JCM 19034]
MESDLSIWVSLIYQYGYLALFFILIIGLFLFPVPNEVLLMSCGLIATKTFLSPFPTFCVLFASVLFHGSMLYIIGTKIKLRAAGSFEQSETSKWRKAAYKGKELLDCYGLKVASFSYFFPFLRHAVPLGMGMSKVHYRWFAIVAFSSGFIWTSLYFWIGFYFGRMISDWTSFVYSLIVMMAIIVFLFFLVHVGKSWLRKKGQSPS